MNTTPTIILPSLIDLKQQAHDALENALAAEADLAQRLNPDINAYEVAVMAAKLAIDALAQLVVDSTLAAQEVTQAELAAHVHRYADEEAAATIARNDAALRLSHGHLANDEATREHLELFALTSRAHDRAQAALLTAATIAGLR